MPNPRTGLQDTDRLHKVRGKNELLVPVNAQSVRRVLVAKNVKGALHVLGPLMDNVKVLIGLDQTAGGGTQCRAHVGYVESSVRLRTNLVCDGSEKGTVALLELGAVGVGRVEVEGSILVAIRESALKEV